MMDDDDDDDDGDGDDNECDDDDVVFRRSPHRTTIAAVATVRGRAHNKMTMLNAVGSSFQIVRYLKA